MKKGYCLLLALLVIGLLLSGCQKKLDELVADSGLLEPTRAMLDGLIQEDLDACLTLLPSELAQEEFQSVYPALVEALADVEEYTLTATNFRTKLTNGISSTTVGFRMDAGDRMFQVETTRSSNQEGLVAFHISQQVAETVTGGLDTLRQLDMAQWLCLILGLAVAAFQVWMLVDCIRHKFRNKVVWVLLMLLGNLVLSFLLTSQRFNLNFNVGLLMQHTALFRYSSGGFLLRLQLPIGTMVYVCRRKKLLMPPAEEPKPQEM